jgi:hypothetical protein
VSAKRSAGEHDRRNEMRRLLLVVALFITTAVVTAPTGCEDPYAGVTKVYVVNNTENPFHPNGGDRLDLGCSREVLNLKHSYSADITIVRNGTKLATLEVLSLIKESEESNYEVAIHVTEPETQLFEAAVDTAGVIQVTVSQ